MRGGLTLSLLALACVPTGVVAQTAGAIAGRVTDAQAGVAIAGAVVEVDRGLYGAVTGADGAFRVHQVRPGLHRVTIRAVGYRPLVRDSVFVTTGRTVVLDVQLVQEAIQLPGVVVEAPPDALLDAHVTATVQPISSEELRDLPITTLEEAVALQAGVVEGSIRGGRVGQDVFVVDGLTVKNQLDASSGTGGLRIPPVALQEATLVTNGFSARYGQALSGLLTAVTKDGGARLEGSVGLETDRPLPDGWDYGLDRFVVSVGGPVGLAGMRFFTALDAQARVDDDPVSTLAPTDPLDPRTARPWVLPHNAGERYDALGKLTIPIGGRQTLRLLGVLSARQRLLFDPVLKYVPDHGAGERVNSRLVMAHLERVSRPDAANMLILDLRVGLFEKQAIRAPLLTPPDFRFGAFSVAPHDFAGEAIARARDSLVALDVIPGFERPSLVSATPWGVPAFFMTASPRGELAWNRFREGRLRVDAFWGRGRDTDIRLGGEYVRQRVEKFTRLEAFRSVAAGAPLPALAVFSPFQAAGYGELLHRLSDLTVSVGVRVDAFNPRAPVDTGSLATAVAVSPRFAVSTSLKGATVVGSYGRFAQPPDFQYLTDIAFDDTLRTGRFRRGNPSLGFETSTQYEFQVRFRPSPTMGVRVGVFVKRLDGLVASVPVGLEIDSAVLGNADFGDVRGLELTLQRDFVGGLGARLTYVLQKAEATASDALQLFRRLRISPVGDTVVPAPVAFPLDFDRRHSVIFVGRARVPEAAGAVLRGLEAGVVARWSSGLPFSRTTPTGDSLIGLPNSDRLPFHYRIDLLVRRVLHVGGLDLGFYVDVRNLTNRRNVIAVRRDTGSPTVGEPQVQAAAEAAYAENPQPIPYESQRYRSFADTNGDGLISGRDELLPLFERAARDFLQPIFAFGPPRLIRIGAQIGF